MGTVYSKRIGRLLPALALLCAGVPAAHAKEYDLCASCWGGVPAVLDAPEPAVHMGRRFRGRPHLTLH